MSLTLPKHDEGRITNIDGNKVTIAWKYGDPQTLTMDKPVAPEDFMVGGTVTWNGEGWKVTPPTTN